MSTNRGPARSGRRNPALLEPAEQPAAAGGVFVAAKPLLVGEHLLPIGTEVPGAADWPRVEAWVNARHIRAISPGEDYVSYEDFIAEQDQLAAAEEAEATPVVDAEVSAQTQE